MLSKGLEEIFLRGGRAKQDGYVSPPDSVTNSHLSNVFRHYLRLEGGRGTAFRRPERLIVIPRRPRHPVLHRRPTTRVEALRPHPLTSRHQRYEGWLDVLFLNHDLLNHFTHFIEDRLDRSEVLHQGVSPTTVCLDSRHESSISGEVSVSPRVDGLFGIADHE